MAKHKIDEHNSEYNESVMNSFIAMDPRRKSSNLDRSGGGSIVSHKFSRRNDRGSLANYRSASNPPNIHGGHSNDLDF